MKTRHGLVTALSTRLILGLLSSLFILIQPAIANVGVSLNLWRGYNTFFGQVHMTATNPDPITHHRVESPNGKIWREESASTSNGSFVELGFAGLLDECTNGNWTLIRNVGHVTEQTNTFAVSLTGITANMFGDITMVDPLDGGIATANPPNLQWVSTSSFPKIEILVQESNPPQTFGGFATLPGNATSWTPPAALDTVGQLLLIQYQTNNFAGASFSLISGPAVSGWIASADLLSYLYSEFSLPGGGSEIDIAVESPGLTWTTDGDNGGLGWFVQSDEYTIGVSALQSGYAPDYASSWIEATVMGPGTLSFDWNLHGDDYDYFEFSAVDTDDYEYDSFYYYGYEAFGWTSYEVTLEPGPNVMRWNFYNDDTTAGAYDAAFLDNVIYSPSKPDYEAQLSLNVFRVVDGTNQFFQLVPTLDPYPESTAFQLTSPNSHIVDNENSTGYESAKYTSFQAMIDEMESGNWTLVFNPYGQFREEYTFTVDASSLSVNDVAPVVIHNPPYGASEVATNTMFHWQGPNGFSHLSVTDYDEAHQIVGSASVGPSATNWMYSGSLPAGTNDINITYTDYNYSGLVISWPVNGTSDLLPDWGTHLMRTSYGRSQFVVTSGFVPLPVALQSADFSSGGFGLSFISQPGATHTVQCTTNLVVGPWLPVTNFLGTGGLELLTLPNTNSAAFYRVKTE